MKMFSKQKRSARFAQYGFVNLLVWLFIYLVIGPFLSGIPYANHVLSGLFLLVLFSAAGAMTSKNTLLKVSLGLLAVSVFVTVLQSLGLLFFKVDIASIAVVLFLVPMIYSFSGHVLRAKEVTGNIICCALCLYLLIGVLWGGLYAILESVSPGSFAGVLLEQESSFDSKIHHLQYLSFVTLSTLGYGDITPQSHGAASLCQTEAIIGQFFAMVILARLVGIQVAQETSVKK